MKVYLSKHTMQRAAQKTSPEKKFVSVARMS
jgi:hypothetical protein